MVPTGMSEFEGRVRAVVSKLRPGDVVTYGEIAEEAGYPNAARAVGGVMARCEGLPWWRVVTSTGRLVPGHEAEQWRCLAAEGVTLPTRPPGRDADRGPAGSSAGPRSGTPSPRGRSYRAEPNPSPLSGWPRTPGCPASHSWSAGDVSWRPSAPP